MSTRWITIPGYAITICVLPDWGKDTGEKSFRVIWEKSSPLSSILLMHGFGYLWMHNVGYADENLLGSLATVIDQGTFRVLTGLRPLLIS